MLTHDDLDHMEKYGCELGDAMLPELVKMARRYQAWRDAALNPEDTPVSDLMMDMGMKGEIPTPQEFDAMLDQAIAESKQA
jgi:hypothetical protein